MSGKILATVCGLAVGTLGFGLAMSHAQQIKPGQPEKVPTPPPEVSRYDSGTSYGPIEAAEEARRRAVDAEHGAIQRQLQLQDDIRWYNTWNPTPYRYALPYIYAYAPPRAARRVHAALEVYVPPVQVLTPWPRIPGDIYGYPYYPWVQQPTGHDKTWTSPNGYIYRPQYGSPPTQAAKPPVAPQRPTTAAPSTRLQPAVPPGSVTPTGPPATIPAPPKPATPEEIPVPPTEPGPREF